MTERLTVTFADLLKSKGYFDDENHYRIAADWDRLPDASDADLQAPKKRGSGNADEDLQ